MESVNLTIDRREITVPKGRTVLEAALENDIAIPFYCFHPGLGVDGSCRVCIVKIEKLPKLQTACSTLCAEGMVVSTDTPEVIEARAGVFEFLLINHPLDCPVCDKGGECPLQDFAYSFGPDRSRMEFERRVFDGEGARADVDFGPTLMLNRNRCILCTRCVRFMRDVDGDAQIGITDRGAGSQIATYREGGVHSLLSGNLMDVCPVGAILTKDYRFRARPWDNPLVVDTICTLCSKGCNTTVWIKAAPEWASRAPRIARVTPRLNPDVNSYWMCDIGRFDVRWVEGQQRLRQPLARSGAGTLEAIAWHDVLRRLRERLIAGDALAGLRFLASAHASLEELYLLRELATRIAPGVGKDAVVVSWRYREKAQPARTAFKVPPADAPNITGARDLGLNVNGSNDSPVDLSALRSSVEAGHVKGLYVLDPGPLDSIGEVSWVIQARAANALPLLIVQGVLQTALTEAADFVLPGATAFEKEATFTNDQGRVQGAAAVISPPGEALEDCVILANVAAALGVELGATRPDEIRQELARAMADRPSYAHVTQVTFAHPVAARTWLQASNPSERWKWDFMFQDLPPVQTADTIPLKKID